MRSVYRFSVLRGPATVGLMTNGCMQGVAGILLAAGSSRRFGADKQSVLLDGVPMLTRSAQLLLDAGFVEPIVVLGPHAAEHRRLLTGLPLRIVENQDAATGMASSLRTAIDAAAGYDAILVTVCDQPAVTAEHLRHLVAQLHGPRITIVASGYGGTHGVPAVFAKVHFAELRQLQGDRGAGQILGEHGANIACEPLPAGALDIDTAADLQHFQQLRARAIPR